MKLNFNFRIKNLNGEEIQGNNGLANKILGDLLASQGKGNSIKLLDWALKVWNGEDLEIDDTDSDVLYAIIDTSESITALAKAPILKYIKSVKEKK